MERLTYRDQDGMAMMKEQGGWKSGGIAKLAAYEDLMDLDRLREIALADREGRLTIRSRGVNHTCGECANFLCKVGAKQGYCKLRKFVKTRYGKLTGEEFRPYRSRRACAKDYVLKEGC